MFYCRLDTRCALPAILNRQSGGILQPLPSNFLLREGDMSRKPSEGVGTRTRAASASVVVDKRSRGHDAAPPSSGASHGTVGSKGATTDMARKRTRVSEVPPIKPLARHGEDVGEPERPPVRVGWVLLRGAVATAPRAASPCVHTGTGRCVTPAFLATAPNHGACPLPPRAPAAPCECSLQSAVCAISIPWSMWKRLTARKSPSRPCSASCAEGPRVKHAPLRV